MAILSNDSDYDLLPCVWRLFTSCTQWKFWDTQIWPLVLVFSAFPVGRKKASTKERFWTWKLNSCDVTLKWTKGLISPLLISTSLSPTKAEHKHIGLTILFAHKKILIEKRVLPMLWDGNFQQSVKMVRLSLMLFPIYKWRRFKDTARIGRPTPRESTD